MDKGAALSTTTLSASSFTGTRWRAPLSTTALPAATLSAATLATITVLAAAAVASCHSVVHAAAATIAFAATVAATSVAPTTSGWDGILCGRATHGRKPRAQPSARRDRRRDFLPGCRLSLDHSMDKGAALSTTTLSTDQRRDLTLSTTTIPTTTVATVSAVDALPVYPASHASLPSARPW